MTDRPTPNAARLPEVVEAARPHARCLVPQDDTKGCPPAGPFPGLRAAVICSSVTGNTRRVAEALTLGRFPLYDVRQRPDTAAYDPGKTPFLENSEFPFPFLTDDAVCKE